LQDWDITVTNIEKYLEATYTIELLKQTSEETTEEW